MNSVCVAGWFYYPLHLLSEEQLSSFKEALTYKSPFSDKAINLYVITDNAIGLPVEWVKTTFPSLFKLATDARVAPGKITYSRLPSHDHPSVKNPEAQKKFMDDLASAVREHNNVLAYAPTGSGKTVVALKTVAELGHRALVLVHTEVLRDQWIAEIEEKLGIPRDRIGIIQQNKCEIEGKDIVISILNTLAKREYDSSVYDSFGSIIVDECHKISTEFFADVLPKFNAKYRIGLSATPKRKDGSDIVLYNHLGQIRVAASTEIMPIKVYVKKYYAQRKLWGKDEQQRIACLVKDKDRNDYLVSIIKQLYDANRNVVIISNSVKHLEILMEASRLAGIPSYEMGLFASTCSVYDKTHSWKVIGKRKLSKKEKDDAKTRKIIFAVDMLMKEAVDIPRLDAGLDAVPFWNATQRLGRIRRYEKGKLYPKWITIKDMKCEFSKKMYNSRVQEYVECGAEIILV